LIGAASKENGFSKLPLIDESADDIIERVMHSGAGPTEPIGRAAMALEE
jgi:hypothetical protein